MWVRSTAGAALAIMGLAILATAAVATRYLVFEYTHGDQQIVEHLLDSLLP